MLQTRKGARSALGTFNSRVRHDVPLQPDFSFRGRTLRTFRRHMNNWRNEIEIPISTPIEYAIRNRVWAAAIKIYSVLDDIVLRVNPNPVAATRTAMTMLTSDKHCQYQYWLQATPKVVPM